MEALLARRRHKQADADEDRWVQPACPASASAPSRRRRAALDGEGGFAVPSLQLRPPGAGADVYLADEGSPRPLPVGASAPRGSAEADAAPQQRPESREWWEAAEGRAARRAPVRDMPIGASREFWAFHLSRMRQGEASSRATRSGGHHHGPRPHRGFSAERDGDAAPLCRDLVPPLFAERRAACAAELDDRPASGLDDSPRGRPPPVRWPQQRAPRQEAPEAPQRPALPAACRPTSTDEARRKAAAQPSCQGAPQSPCGGGGGAGARAGAAGCAGGARDHGALGDPDGSASAAGRSSSLPPPRGVQYAQRELAESCVVAVRVTQFPDEESRRRDVAMQTVHEKFVQVGLVDKIIISRKRDDLILALVQYGSVACAKEALQRFDGTSLTDDDCNMMSITFSVKQDLVVWRNTPSMCVFEHYDGGGEERAADMASARGGHPQDARATPSAPSCPRRSLRMPLPPMFDEDSERPSQSLPSNAGSRSLTGWKTSLRPENMSYCARIDITRLFRPGFPAGLCGLHVCQIRACCGKLGNVSRILCAVRRAPRSAPPPSEGGEGSCVEAIVEWTGPAAVVDVARRQLDGASLTGDDYNIMEVQPLQHAPPALDCDANTPWYWSASLPARPAPSAEAVVRARRESACLAAKPQLACRRSSWPQPLPLRLEDSDRFSSDEESPGVGFAGAWQPAGALAAGDAREGVAALAAAAVAQRHVSLVAEELACTSGAAIAEAPLLAAAAPAVASRPSLEEGAAAEDGGARPMSPTSDVEHSEALQGHRSSLVDGSVRCAECAELRPRRMGRVDPEDGEWYCVDCWFYFEQPQELKIRIKFHACSHCGAWSEQGNVDPTDGRWYCATCWFVAGHLENFADQCALSEASGAFYAGGYQPSATWPGCGSSSALPYVPHHAGGDCATSPSADKDVADQPQRCTGCGLWAVEGTADGAADDAWYCLGCWRSSRSPPKAGLQSL